MEMETQRRAMARRLRMDYYNQILLDKGVLTQKEYLRMAQMICQKYPEPKVINQKGTA